MSRADDDPENERPERSERSERTEPSGPGRDEPREHARDRTDRPDRDDRIAETIRQKLEQLVPDLVKRTFSAGMGAVFHTEEGIRRVASSARENLPEVAGYIASSADSAKDKVFEVIARETREFLSNINLTEEIAKLLTTLSFEIKTEVRFIPNSERITGASPDVKASVRVKRNDEAIGRDKPAEREPHTPRESRDPRDPRDRDDEPAARDSRSRLRFWRRDGEDRDPRDTEDEGEDHDK